MEQSDGRSATATDARADAGQVRVPAGPAPRSDDQSIQSGAPTGGAVLPDREWLTPAEAAAWMGLRERDLRWAAQNNQLPHLQIGRTLLFSRTSLVLSLLPQGDGGLVREVLRAAMDDARRATASEPRSVPTRAQPTPFAEPPWVAPSGGYRGSSAPSASPLPEGEGQDRSAVVSPFASPPPPLRPHPVPVPPASSAANGSSASTVPAPPPSPTPGPAALASAAPPASPVGAPERARPARPTRRALLLAGGGGLATAAIALAAASLWAAPTTAPSAPAPLASQSTGATPDATLPPDAAALATAPVPTTAPEPSPTVVPTGTPAPATTTPLPPTATQAPATATQPPATATPPPATATPPAATATALPPVSFQERFTTNQRGWPDDRRGPAWLGEGGYRLHARQPGRFVAVGPASEATLKNVGLTGTFRKIDGPPGGGYGFVVRDQGPGPRDGLNQGGRFYALEASDRGEIGVWRRDGDRWVDLVPWSHSAAVRPGRERNELKVRAVGPRLVFSVNGSEVASVEDATLAEGRVGIFVGGDDNQVLLERLTVEQID